MKEQTILILSAKCLKAKWVGLLLTGCPIEKRPAKPAATILRAVINKGKIKSFKSLLLLKNGVLKQVQEPQVINVSAWL